MSAATTEPTLVYLGPSLPIDAARALLDADFRPPVRRGDLPSRYAGTIVIIDGEFGQSLAVSPKEILRLLDAGTRVIGAASMGALRAAELHTLGMEGYGWIFHAYKCGRIVRDDEVALCYSPLGYTPVTVPLINVRYWLESLQQAGHIDQHTARKLFAHAGRIFFADRTEERLQQEWALTVSPECMRHLLEISPGGITDVKASDAALALTAAADGQAVTQATHDRGDGGNTT
jgi:TfuA protein